MIAAEQLDRRDGKLVVVDAQGTIRSLRRADLARLFEPGDLVIANDAATLPASLRGTHAPSGAIVEVRLAGWTAIGDPTRFIAILFGAGDHRTRTEDRPSPPMVAAGDRLILGPLHAAVECVFDHPRLVLLCFLGERAQILAGLARHGRPIQYAHAPAPLALWDVWTRIAAAPVAFEPPSAGFALDWAMIAAWRGRGVGFATLTHAAGVSSTGDPALDQRLPFDEPYHIPAPTAAAITKAKAAGGRIIAIGTTVVRALEAAANSVGMARAGDGVASGRITHKTIPSVVGAILTGVHQSGESHFELLRAFASDTTLDRMSAAFLAEDFRAHEFGDSALIEREASASRHERRSTEPLATTL